MFERFKRRKKVVKHSTKTCSHFELYGPVGCHECPAREKHGCEGWKKKQ